MIQNYNDNNDGGLDGILLLASFNLFPFRQRCYFFFTTRYTKNQLELSFLIVLLAI